MHDIEGMTMNVNEFTTFLDGKSDMYEWKAGEHEGAKGVFVMNKILLWH